MFYLWIKALHIIFVITWFAGLFYIVRLFVYTSEALQKEDPQRAILLAQYQKMQRGLWYGITWPSCLLTLIFGFLLVDHLNYWTQPWMMAKFSMVFLLLIYQVMCHRFFVQQQAGQAGKSAYFYRLWNELATVILISIIFLVVWKNALTFAPMLIGMSITSVLIFFGVYWAKKKRDQSHKS